MCQLTSVTLYEETLALMQAEIVVQLSNGAFIDDLYILYCGIMHQMILSWLTIFLTTIVTIVLQKKKKKMEVHLIVK